MKGILTLSLLLLSASIAYSATLPDETLGHWKGTRRDGGDGTVAPMSLLVESLTDGLGTIERIEVTTEGDPYVGFTVRLKNPETGEWTAIYGNDVRERFARMKAVFEEERTLWNSTTVRPPRLSRLVSQFQEDGLWRRTQEHSDDGGRTWKVRFVDELRKEEAPND